MVKGGATKGTKNGKGVKANGSNGSLPLASTSSNSASTSRGASNDSNSNSAGSNSSRSLNGKGNGNGAVAASMSGNTTKSVNKEVKQQRSTLSWKEQEVGLMGSVLEDSAGGVIL